MLPDEQGPEDTVEAEMNAALAAPEPASTEAPQAPESAPPAAPESPAAPDPSSEGDSPAPANPASQTPDESQAPDPFAGGEPFAFRVDGRQVALEGAKVINGHVVIPEATWHNQARHFLADRSAIKERTTAYQREVAQERQARQAVEAQHQAIMAEVQQMFADPNVMLDKLNRWQTEGPLLQAQIEARAAKAQVEQFHRQQQELRRQEQEAAQEPQLRQQVGDVIEEWLDDAKVDWRSQPETWVEFVRHLWDVHGRDGLFGRDGLNEDRLHREFQREVARFRAQTQVAKQVEKKVELNKAAAAPPKPKPPTPGKPQPRKADGTYSKKPAPDNPEDWEEWFRTTQFTA